MKTHADIVIIGAGMSGLTAAYCLGDQCTLLERHDAVGGLCRSETVKEFTFDYAGHVLHFNGSGRDDFLLSMLGPYVQRHERNAWVHSQGTLVKYPFQAHLHGMPERIVNECVSGLESALREEGPSQASHFEDWVVRHFGVGFAKHFLLPYNRKLWSCDLTEMSSTWAERFIPIPSLEEVRDGANGRQLRQFGYNTSFHYPTEGIGALPASFVPHISDLRLGTGVVSVDPEKHKVYLDDGTTLAYTTLITTIPLPELIRLIQPCAPTSVTEAAGALRCVSVHTLNLGIKRHPVSDKHWMYFPDEDICFYRVSFPSNLSRSLAPPGTSSLCVEVSYRLGNPHDPDELDRRIMEDLIRTGLLRDNDEVLVRKRLDIPYAYPILDHDRDEAVATLQAYLQENHIRSLGRFGCWQYMSVADVVHQARQLVEELRDE